MPSSLLIVTVTYNSADALGDFLASIGPATVLNADVIVVDNASTDVAEERAIAERAGVELLALPTNGGYGAGVTAGVAARGADHDFVLVANPDVAFTTGAIDILLAAAEGNQKAGALGPRILDPDGTLYPSARSLPSLRTGIGHALFSQAWPKNPWTRRYRASDQYSSSMRPAGWLSGACLLLRMSAFDEVGGFDPSFFMYFEDVDLGARLGRAGWTNLYVPQATVVHSGAHSTSREAGAMDRVHHESAYRYLSKKYSAWYLTPLRIAIRFALAVRVWWRGRR